MTQVRHQRRARHAYERVAEVVQQGPDAVQDYKIAVDSFGGHVLRGGLSAAVSWLQRGGAEAGSAFLDDLATADLRGIGVVRNADEFAAAVRTASIADYMLATRDAIAVVAWFRRAVQAAGCKEGAT